MTMRQNVPSTSGLMRSGTRGASRGDWGPALALGPGRSPAPQGGVVIATFRRLSTDPSHQRSRAVEHGAARSEEHTSELQSHVNLVCRLLLEKKKKNSPPSFFIQRKNKREPIK